MVFPHLFSCFISPTTELIFGRELTLPHPKGCFWLMHKPNWQLFGFACYHRCHLALLLFPPARRDLQGARKHFSWWFSPSALNILLFCILCTSQCQGKQQCRQTLSQLRVPLGFRLVHCWAAAAGSSSRAQELCGTAGAVRGACRCQGDGEGRVWSRNKAKKEIESMEGEKDLERKEEWLQGTKT